MQCAEARFITPHVFSVHGTRVVTDIHKQLSLVRFSQLASVVLSTTLTDCPAGAMVGGQQWSQLFGCLSLGS